MNLLSDFMKCPRCKTDLIDTEIDGERVSCCRECAGILLKQRSLNPILSGMCARIDRKLSANSLVQKVLDLGPVKRCPECDSLMENYGYMESNKVFVDFCDSCNSLWLDPLELLTMVDMYAVSKKHTEYLKKTFHEGADLMGPYANSQAAMKGLVWGALGIVG